MPLAWGGNRRQAIEVKPVFKLIEKLGQVDKSKCFGLSIWV